MILPRPSAKATEASLPLGSINPNNKSYTDIISPLCSSAVVPGV